VKWSRILFAVVITLIVLLLAGCYNGSYEPYLVVAVNDEYTAGTVTLGYSFLSEKAEQLCRVYLTTPWAEEYWYCRDERLPASGNLVFEDLSPGWYTLYFAVLSEKGREPAVILFLEESYNFLVR